MRIGAVPEGLMECAGLALGLVPLPFLDTMVALMLARTLMTATKSGIFDAMAAGHRSPQEIAVATGMNASATGKLLRALQGSGYVVWKISGYELSSLSKKWLVGSQRDIVLHRLLDALVIDQYEVFLRTGEASHIFERLTPEQWRVYQGGQRVQADLMIPEVVRRTPIPRGATTLLDVGGGHGAYSVGFCRRIPGLHATVLDLAPTAALYGAAVAPDTSHARVSFQSGNALTCDLGIDAFDLILVANLAHHLTQEVNGRLIGRIARALRPDGSCVIVDAVRPESPGDSEQMESLMDFYFGCASGGGTWTGRDFANWQRHAGLEPLPLKRLISVRDPNRALSQAGTALTGSSDGQLDGTP
jgi:SAM-dependent methyltransferase